MTSLAERILAVGRTNPIEQAGKLPLWQRILQGVPETGTLKAPIQTPAFPTPASAVPLWQKIIGGQQGETFPQTYQRVGAENTAATKAVFDPNASPELRKKGQDIYAGMTFGFTGMLQNVAKKGAIKGVQTLKGSADDVVKNLTSEARKYGNAEEFRKGFVVEGNTGLSFHLTDNPNFKIQKGISPTDMSSLAGRGKGGEKGLMITGDLNAESVSGLRRKYVAIIDTSKLTPAEKLQVKRGFGDEIFLDEKVLDRVSVKKVVSLEEAGKIKEKYRNYINKTFQKSEDFDTFWNKSNLLGEAQKAVAEGGDNLAVEARKYKSAEDMVGKEFKLPIDNLKPSQPSAKVNVEAGSLSKSSVNPVDIEIKNGEIFIVDGNHRYYEALARGDKEMRVRFPEYIKRIDRGEMKALTSIWEKAQPLQTSKTFQGYDDLTSEARKYKSAEEFVKGQTFYRGEGAGKGGNYFTRDQEFANEFAGIKPLTETTIPENLIYRPKTLPEAVNEQQVTKAIAEAKKNGAKAVYVSEGSPFGEPIESVFVFDKSAIKTKSQLTDIWNKAQKLR